MLLIEGIREGASGNRPLKAKKTIGKKITEKETSDKVKVGMERKGLMQEDAFGESTSGNRPFKAGKTVGRKKLKRD